jgi:dTDP-D-glucose 4,6-dehydratase
VREVVMREMPELGEIAIETSPTDDLRSYHVSSEKIKRELGWTPKRTIEDAVKDLCRAFKAGKLPNSLTDPRYFNVKAIQESGLEKTGSLVAAGV